MNHIDTSSQTDMTATGTGAEITRSLTDAARGVRVHRPAAQSALGIGALAMGALALGALAFGALAIGRLAVGKGVFGSMRIGRLEIDELVVRKSALASGAEDFTRDA